MSHIHALVLAYGYLSDDYFYLSDDYFCEKHLIRTRVLASRVRILLAHMRALSQRLVALWGIKGSASVPIHEPAVCHRRKGVFPHIPEDEGVGVEPPKPIV
jgi:hypothetical protein